MRKFVRPGARLCEEVERAIEGVVDSAPGQHRSIHGKGWSEGHDNPLPNISQQPKIQSPDQTFAAI